MPETRYMAPTQHVRESAPDMAQQAGQEVHHRPRHAGHLDEEPKEHEQRHGQQDQVRHALVHAADDHRQRRRRREREVAECAQPEREGDGNAGKDATCRDTDEEDEQVEPAEPLKQRTGKPEDEDEARHQGQRREPLPGRRFAQQPQHGECRHQDKADRQRRRAPCVGDAERRRRDGGLVGRVLPGRPRDHRQKGQAGRGRNRLDHARVPGGVARPVRSSSCARPAATPLTAPSIASQRNRMDAQLVGPHERGVKREARDHAREQNYDLDEHQHRRERFHERPRTASGHLSPSSPFRRSGHRALSLGASGRVIAARVGSRIHASFPVLRSRMAHASLPNLLFHSA